VRELGYDAGELKGIWEIEAARTREEDRRDYEREMAGIDIGRDARFLGTEFVEERRQGRGSASSAQRAQRDFTSRLQMLLATNAGYAKIYNDTMGALCDAEKAADDALEKLEAALSKARRETQHMLERAAKLADGRRVFKDKNGQVWDEHGTCLSDEQAASIQWRGDEPTQEAFKEQSRYADDLSRSVDEMRGVQVDLGDIREEMTDKDNPPTQERTEGLRGRIQELDHETQKHLGVIREDQVKPAEVHFAGTHMMVLPPG
jgi:hypothetical protein